MIKFFGKIRANLLSDGKTGKYIKYAVGEIILVVVGILIALSINNWNENRKNQVLIENYTENLIKDLTKDSISISNSILRIKHGTTTLNNYKRRISISPAPLDTILKIARYEYTFLLMIHKDYNYNTYNVLTSTGNINLFKSEIIKGLNELNNLQAKAIYSQNQTFESYRSNLTWYAQKYPVAFKSNILANGTTAADIIWGQISLIQHATDFNSLIIREGDSHRLSLNNLPKVLDKTNILLANLRRLE